MSNYKFDDDDNLSWMSTSVWATPAPVSTEPVPDETPWKFVTTFYEIGPGHPDYDGFPFHFGRSNFLSRDGWKKTPNGWKENPWMLQRDEYYFVKHKDEKEKMYPIHVGRDGGVYVMSWPELFERFNAYPAGWENR